MSKTRYQWQGKDVAVRFGFVKVRPNTEKPLYWYNFECETSDDQDPRDGTNPDTAIDWIIFGGESGTGARDTDMAWAGEVARECEKAGVPFFFKQFGTYLSKHLGLKDTKGGDLSEVAHLPGAADFVRQIPT